MGSTHEATALVTFEGLSMAEAGQAARELGESLRDRGIDELRTELRKENLGTQDLGTTLVLIFGSSAAAAVARGIAAYIAKRGSRVHIKTSQGEIIATGDAATNIDTAKAAEALKKLAG